ncbi:hypothetical protein D9611_001266 [Ephemerocybe angulata]|uniref:AAA+ ATPase domain-containing protein n=1 Tax=Ephemerocybe angulata TaxID=980116 RepID=A0A8H5FMS5_9AGAR|nr:hypothetical protein D9611_001266 [Tulosesus angulatus]
MTSNSGTAEVAEAPAGPSSRIARYDQFFDPRKRMTVYRKTNKSDLVKHFQKLKQKNPVLVVRRKIDHRGRLEGTVVDLKSPKLANFLQDLYEGVEGQDIARNPPWCDSKLLAHSRNELQKRLRTERSARNPDQEFIEDLEIALAFVEEDHGSTFTDMDALLYDTDTPSVTFDLLWTLYRPGSLAYSYDEFTDQGRIVRVQTFAIHNSPTKGVYALIQTQMVAHDGKTFGTAAVYFEIPMFAGTRPLKDLPVYPLEHFPEREALKQRALKRGKKFVDLLQHSFHEVSGSAVYEIQTPELEWERRRFLVQGRVMIDPSAYRVWQHATSSVINPPVVYHLDPRKLTEEEYMLCTPIVLGFSFTTKKWGGYALDRLTDVEWSSKPFDSLVLNPKTKDLVHSMVKQHTSGTSDFDDIVKGKGKGLVGLLCGPPGCGKTLTAEAVAEVTHCPLYCLSAGELGTELKGVEEMLTQVLELAYKWKAVVLLDEADVFLAQRDSVNIERNALVSIFLRKLEYYQGILILTTNLITQCDIAFESRIHFTIHYPILSSESQIQIWKTFIAQTSGKGRITDNDLKALSKVTMNGRQIKNAVSVAQSFASGANLDLSIDHIYTVLEVMRDWQKAKEAMGSESSGYVSGPNISTTKGGVGAVDARPALTFLGGILTAVIMAFAMKALQ